MAVLVVPVEQRALSQEALVASAVHLVQQGLSSLPVTDG